MARTSGKILLACVGLAYILSGPAFVPTPAAARQSQITAAASGALLAAGTALPAFARIPGGKFTKSSGAIAPTPDEDGYSDSEVAFALIVAAVTLYLAIDFAKYLYYNVNGASEAPKTMTPFEKRMVAAGKDVSPAFGRAGSLGSLPAILDVRQLSCSGTC
eukprot:CAMPEP_0178459144 /NCGR_PEP_ID=MMETSP0689_2-20121128/47954_1 /TAXON_ID=160604 /ORGANISM="Amphidinium massartii, Strain CS-259" /LENGTH=160 /DNA_ID=CAMNT_0020085563 /DNA_START=69 /DNA_END=552 /DNA_ORIENTATION=-